MIRGYEILSSIGSGAFGKTSRVKKGGKIYAMKVLKPEAVRDEVDKKRFQRECRALQKISSDHVIRYHDHGIFDDDGVETYYVVMDFVEGSDLQRRLRGKTFPRPEGEIRDLLAQLLRGLDDIHNKRIVHRDLKPANIFLTREGVVKILDFGLVKMLDYTTLTMTGGAVGTPLYMSPEEMLGRDIDARSDLYSVGVLLFHLLTGKFPFPADNLMRLMRAVTQEPPSHPTNHNAEVSNALENLVLKLLEKEPFLRPSSAQEVAELLERTPFYRVEETPAPAAGAWSFRGRKCFIRMLPNEKGIVDRFTAGHSLDGVVFQANYLPRYSRHLELLRSRKVPYLFDPSTNRLAYSKFSETEGLRKLPYVFDRMNRLTPERLRSIGEIRRYVREVLNWQIQHGCTYLVSPFHFSKTLTSEWLEVDLKLLAEAREYVASKGREEKLFAGICTNIEHLTDEDNRKTLVNRYSRHPADGYLFYVDPINERTSVPGQLYSYLSMLMDFKGLGNPLIAGRVGSMGLGVSALGIDGFETGIASLTFFSEQTLLQDRPRGYTMQIRYYVPDLLASLPVETATDILGSGKHRELICRCPYCGGSTEPAALKKVAKEHFLYHRMREMEALNALEEGERLPAFLTRTEKALRLTVDIRRKLGIEMTPHQHFKTWLEVFPEVARRT